MSFEKMEIIQAEPQNGQDALQWEAYFNPESLKVSLSNNLGGDENSDQATQPAKAKLETTLIFDSTAGPNGGKNVEQNKGSGDVRFGAKEGSQIIKKMATPRPDANNAPPVLDLIWGNFKFRGVIESFNETLDFWSAEGVPLRSTVQLTVQGVLNEGTTGFDEIVNEGIEIEPNELEDSALGTTEIAAKGGAKSGDSKPARDIAKKNGLESMRKCGASGSAGGGIAVGGSVELKAAAGFSAGLSAGASVGFGFGAAAGGGTGLGIGGGIGAGIGGGISAGIGGGIEASVGGSVGAGGSFGASFGGGATAGLSAGIGAGASATAGFAATTGGTASAGLTAGLTSSFSASAGMVASIGAGANFSASAGASAGLSAGIGTSASFTSSASASVGLAGSSRFAASGSVSALAGAGFSTASFTQSSHTIDGTTTSFSQLSASEGAFLGLSTKVEKRSSYALSTQSLLPPAPSPKPGHAATFDASGKLIGGANGSVSIRASASSSVTIF